MGERRGAWVTEYGMSLLFFIPISFKQAILRNSGTVPIVLKEVVQYCSTCS